MGNLYILLLFIYSTMYFYDIYLYELKYYIILCLINQSCLICFVLRLFQFLLLVNLSVMSLWHTSNMVWLLFWGKESTSIFSGIISCSRFILRISCASSRNTPFSRRYWFFLLETRIRSQCLGSRCAHFF